MRGKDFCTENTDRIIEDGEETSERSIDIRLSFNHLALIYKRFLNFLKFNEAKCLEFFLGWGGGGGGRVGGEVCLCLVKPYVQNKV